MFFRICPLLLFVILACKKTNTEVKKEQIPVIHYLSDTDRKLFNFYYTNKTIRYSNGSNQELVFGADSIYSITSHEEGNLRHGEELSIRYYCKTSYFPNYSYNLNLTVDANQKLELSIIFGTGTYWYDRANDYVLSFFSFLPKTKVDFADSIVLRNKTFYNVYYIERPSGNGENKVTMNCYYTNTMGIIAFKNRDGNFWIRD